MLAFSMTVLLSFAGVAPAGVPSCPVGVRAPDPFHIDLVPTANANYANGAVRLRFADSPFGVTVTQDGHHTFDAAVTTAGLAHLGGALVVWAASPALDIVQRLGALRADGTLDARIKLNKFLVFVTHEANAGVERWAGPILLRGISASGRMHTMAGHGPFFAEPCAAWGFGPIRSPDPLP